MATDVLPDVRTDGFKTSGATSLAWNATVNAGLTNSILVGEGTTGSSTAKRISTYQWDAAGTPVALTNLTFRIDGGSNCYAELWYLKSPTSGTKQVKITPTASCEITGGSASYQFVNQTTPWNASSPQTNAGTAVATQPNLTLTSANHEMGVTCALENSSGSSITGISTSAGQTQIFNETVGATSHAGVGSDKLSTGGTVALSYTGVQNGNPWVCVGGSLQFDGGGGGTTFTDSVSESGTAADSSSAIATLPGTRTETLTAAETESAAALLPGTRTESLTAAESESATATLPATVAESLAAAEAETGVIATPAARTESLTAAEAQDATVVAAGASSVSETLNAGDSVSATVTLAGAVSESVTAADTSSAAAIFVAVRTESAAALNSIVATLVLQGIVVDVMAAMDGESAVALLSGSVHDVLAASEVVIAGGGVVTPEYPPGRFTLDDIQPRFALDDISPRFALDDPQATFTLRQDYPS